MEEPDRAFYIRSSGPAASCKLGKTTRQRPGGFLNGPRPGRGHLQHETSACSADSISTIADVSRICQSDL